MSVAKYTTKFKMKHTNSAFKSHVQCIVNSRTVIIIIRLLDK